MSSPKLSIIVPIYNAEAYLEKCLTSIQNQSFSDWECILIDDGSTDHSYSICESFEVKDKRFKFIHKYNSGVSDTRNLGLYLAKGEWIGFVDSDDWISPDRYELCLNTAITQDVQIVKCSIEQIRTNGTTCVWSVPEGKYLIENRIILSTPDYDNSSAANGLYKASLLKDNNIQFTDCKYGEDFLFNVEAFTFAGSLYSIDKPLYHYQRHTESLSTSKVKSGWYIKMLNCLNAVCDKLDSVENFKYFKDIVINNFYTRKSTINLRKDCIDYVVPFVDCSDPAWIEEYNKYAPGKIDQDSNGVERFRASQELFKYHFRGIAKYMPWIDTVHLLVMSDSQVPDWINRDQVHIIYHKDFINEDLLPTFNSSTIEMFLSQIKGLPERFIYANDDFYYTYTLKDKFYFENEKIKTRIEAHPIEKGEIIPIWKKTFINSYNLAKSGTIDVPITGNKYFVPPHIEQGYTMSLLKEVWDKYNKQMIESCSKFRENKNLNQYLYTDYAALNGKSIDGVHSYRNFNSASKPELIQAAVLNLDTTKVIRSFVLNDTGDSENTKVLLENLAKILPEKCKYEL